MSERAFAYAWMLEGDELCFWAEPSKAQLIKAGKPSPEAKIVRVELVRVTRKKERL